MAGLSDMDRVSSQSTETLGNVTTDIETQILHRRIISKLVHSGTHALLHAAANRPILAIDEVPEVHRVGWIEIRLGYLASMEHKTARDHSSVRTLRPQQECDYMLGAQAEQEIWINDLALVALLSSWLRVRNAPRPLVPSHVNLNAPPRSRIPFP